MLGKMSVFTYTECICLQGRAGRQARCVLSYHRNIVQGMAWSHLSLHMSKGALLKSVQGFGINLALKGDPVEGPVYWCLSASVNKYVCGIESIGFSRPSLLFICGLYFQRIIFPVWNDLILNHSVPAGLAVIPSPSSTSVFAVLLLVQDETFSDLKLSFFLPRSICSAWASICTSAHAPCLAERKGLGALTQARSPRCLEMEYVHNAPVLQWVPILLQCLWHP